MLIIPELNTVVITPPRTGSTALRNAVLSKYKSAFSPYRHMERDGIPFAYRDCDVLCTFRRPVSRMKSLHRYMGEVSRARNPHAPRFWIDRLRARDPDFATWLVHSTEVFSDPYNDRGDLVPHYSTMRPVPITRKPIADYARPDLGPLRTGGVNNIARHLGVSVSVENRTMRSANSESPSTALVHEWFKNWHAADLAHAARPNAHLLLSEWHEPTYKPRFTYMENTQ